MTDSIRISKKVLAQFPEAIATRIGEIRKRFKLASFRYHIKDESQEFYFDEGAKVWAFYGDEEVAIAMVSAHTFGSLECHAVGTKKAFKAGTTLLEVNYFMGKYFLNIHNFSEKKDAKLTHTFEPAFSFNDEKLDSYKVGKRYDKSNLKECMIVAAKSSRNWNNVPFYVVPKQGGYLIVNTLDGTEANHGIYKVIGNDILLGLPNLNKNRETDDFKTEAIALNSETRYTKNEFGQLELFPTEDRQLSLF